MVAFNSSFRVFLVSAIVLGMSANAAPSPASDNPGAWGRRGDPGSPGSHNSGSSSKSSVSAYSVNTKNGECMANSASRARYTDQAFLKLAPELASEKSSNRRGLTNTPRGPGSDDEALKKTLGFDTDKRPDPTDPEGITLFHGTLPRFAALLHAGVRIFDNRGDLSEHGGFYLTNSLRAAAQWGCHGRGEDIPATVVFEYRWTPEKTTKIRSHKDWKTAEEYAAFCSYNTCGEVEGTDEATQASIKSLVADKYDMIAGPMMPVGGAITAGFYQYAILNEQTAKEPTLQNTGYHLLDCANFPPGDIETHDTQGPVAKFSEDEIRSIGLKKENSYPGEKLPPTEWKTGDDTISLAARPKPN